MQLEELRMEQGKMVHEKEVLENQLEAEQEYIVHKLQKQAAHIAAERQALQLEKGDLKRQVQILASAADLLCDAGLPPVSLAKTFEGPQVHSA